MGSNYTPSSLQSGFRSLAALNNEFQEIKDSIDRLLSRKGDSPNQMDVPIDMNSNEIVNLAAPTNNNSAARLQDIEDLATVDDVQVSLAEADVPSNKLINDRGFIQSVDSVANLQSGSFQTSLNRIWLSGYYGVGTPGGGALYRDSDDTTTADNGGTVFVDSNSVRWKRSIQHFITPEQFGAVGDWDGTTGTDSGPAVQAAIESGNPVVFETDNQYLFNTAVVITQDNVHLDLRNATLVNGGPQHILEFGEENDTPLYENIRVLGGTFIQADPATTQNRNYIAFRAVENFEVSGSILHNISNGGILCNVGCQDGLIDGVRIYGVSGFSTARGIWLLGSGSDFQSELIDEATLTRNANPLPQFAVKRVTVRNIHYIGPGFGVYAMNTRDCRIEGSYIELTGSGQRCLVINNYSPGFIVSNNTFRSDITSTGILVTEFSHDVIIESNTFLGTFGGNRDIQIQFLSTDVLINNNVFATNTNRQIVVDTAGSVICTNNISKLPEGFQDNRRFIVLANIGLSDRSDTRGSTATILPGSIISNNILSPGRIIRADMSTNTSTNNTPAIEYLVAKNNVFSGADQLTIGGEFCIAVTNGNDFSLALREEGNDIFPIDAGSRTLPFISGDVIKVKTDLQSAIFRIEVASGAVTVSDRLVGGYMSIISTSVITNEVQLVIRTRDGAAGAKVPDSVSVLGDTNTSGGFVTRDGSNTTHIRLVDNTGAILDPATTDVSFWVIASSDGVS